MALALPLTAGAKDNIDYSAISVPEERGVEFVQISQANDYVLMPTVKRKKNTISWLTNRVLQVSPDGQNVAFLSMRDGKTNIFLKELARLTGAQQRTNRSRVIDFNYSPDGKKICFAEDRGTGSQIFLTDANEGFIAQQVTSGANDFSPVYALDMSALFFARDERQGVSIWSWNPANSVLSSYTPGMNPSPVTSAGRANTVLCTRFNGEGRGEIWEFDAKKGTERCLVSDLEHSFSTPQMSPDGKWILVTGSSALPVDNKGHVYLNTDIYVVRSDGSAVRQLTYHAADDISPVWSHDGRFIYFISQRGDSDATPNIWRMPFDPSKL